MKIQWGGTRLVAIMLLVASLTVWVQWASATAPITDRVSFENNPVRGGSPDPPPGRWIWSQREHFCSVQRGCAPHVDNSLPTQGYTDPRAFQTPLTNTIYLPLVAQTKRLLGDTPIWVHSSAPAAHEVALFRCSFSVSETLRAARLVLFADTRYEVWLDGVWVGRGPARFSRATWEYDSYALGELTAGAHLIAALVQWAPNTRRSESTTPFLVGHIEGTTAHGVQITARTSPLWKAQLSAAWRQDAAPVHTWNLIGPTELVDLRRLPADWMQPTFADDDWSAAVPRTVPDAMYQPRSIPFLSQAPITPTVMDAGRLAPGRAVGVLASPTAAPYVLPFEAHSSTVVTVEMLPLPGAALTEVVRLDGVSLTWREADPQRPDVQIASIPLAPGSHTLSFHHIPPQGLAFGLSTAGIQWQSWPFQQGLHAGQRLLLAEPVSEPGLVVCSAEHGLTMTFTTASTYAVLDLGRVIHGRLTAEITGPAGAVIDVGWDERLWQGKRPLPYPGSLHYDFWNQTDSWVLDGTTRRISTLDTRAGRYILIAVWGPAPIRLQNIQVHEERYPVELRGSFSSSDPLLDRIWQVGVDTLLPNMVDAYTDTPWRERGQWWGDAYVEAQINRVAFGDTGLWRRYLLFAAAAFEDGRPTALSPNGPGGYMLDYGMLWIQSLKEYHELTGDTQVVQQVYPILLAFMRYLEGYESPSTGLLDVPVGHWSQTALIDWAGYTSRHGQSTALNAMYSGTLLDAADVAAGLDDHIQAIQWRQKALAVRQQVQANLYQPAERRYLASILAGEPVPPSPHAQAWALAYDLVPDSEVGPVASFLLALLPPDPSSPGVDVYGTFWVLKALGDADRVPEALGVVKRYYGYMLDRGATTWWEAFNSHRSYAASLSHGWGGSPTWFLSSHVLGGTATGPARWRVAPHPGGLEHAQGTIPLGTGVLTIQWQQPECGQFHLTVTAPAGTGGDILLPIHRRDAQVTLNGQLIWDGGPTGEIAVQMTPTGIEITGLVGEIYQIDAGFTCYQQFLPLANCNDG